MSALAPNALAKSTVTALGDILSTNVDTFRDQAFAKAEPLGPGELLDIDLRTVRLIDSVGLNALVTVIKRAKADGGHVRIHVGHQNVRRILAFTRIDQHATVIDPGHT